MNIKKIVKYSFIIMATIIFIITAINTLVIYQIKENNQTKQAISDLVFMQDKMNELLKDTTNVESIEELKQKKEDFLKFELEFEDIEKLFTIKDENDFVDFFISDIHKDKIISTKLDLLFENEKQIEDVFTEIYKLQEIEIQFKKDFDIVYPLENQIRKELDLKIASLKSYEIFKLFSDVEYYSKEALYQYRDKKTLDKWLHKIELLKNNYKDETILEYLEVVNKVGNIVVELKNIEDKELILRNKILDVINQNKVYSSEIQKEIADLTSNFINFTYISILFLLLLIICLIVVLGYKVYKNVGLSVDEIEAKVKDGLNEITKLNEEIENTQKEVVFTMGAIGESRSKETGNHVKRVAEYSKLLALYYGLDEKEAELLKQASPMHDIGKVAIPDAILNKPGRFDENEREIMNTHAALGYEMLKHSNRPLLKMAAIVANEHHEKWDGTGYPKGLSGENIHIYGRITALADVFDALGSHRVYKKAWDDERIFNLFKEERGKHFDPKLVDIFFEHLDEFLKNIKRYCFWLLDLSPNILKTSKILQERISLVKKIRLESNRESTKKLAQYPTLFAEIRQPKSNYIVIPLNTSSNREYLPIGLNDKEIIASNLVSIIESESLYIFGILSSLTHMIWMRYTCGRLGNGYRYSNSIVYNNYPFPKNVSEKQKKAVEEKAQNVLNIRSQFSDCSLADLYDPLSMPPNLKKAHQELDKAVDNCYGSKLFKNDKERIEFLFGLYEEYLNTQK